MLGDHVLKLPKSRLARRGIRIHNPTDQQLVVWLEPWAESFELAPQTSLDVVFVGPKDGLPEVLPRPGVISVYAWEGSEAIAIRDGQLAANQPSVDEIVRQELEIAKEHVARTDEAIPASEIAMAQNALDVIPSLQPESAEDAFKMTAYLICGMAPTLEQSVAATDLLWQIARRIIATKGFVLAAAGQDEKMNAIWSDTPVPLIELIQKCAIPILKRSLRKHRDVTRRRSAESESGPTPR